MLLHENTDPIDRAIMDIISIGTAVATLTSLLPAVAAILTIVWTGIRIFESDSIQRLFGNPLTRPKKGGEADGV